MNKEALELVHGSGNLYMDLGYPDADIRQLKGSLAAEPKVARYGPRKAKA